jgi:hypothetical protein
MWASFFLQMFQGISNEVKKMSRKQIFGRFAWCALLSLVFCFGCDSGGTTPGGTDAGGNGSSARDDSGGQTSEDSDSSDSANGAAPVAGWGSLTGRFVYDGTAPTPTALNITKDEDFCGQHNLVDESLVVGEDGGVANVVVYVRTKDVAIHPDLEAAVEEKVVFDNKNCRFEPHVLPIWFDRQALVIHNSDPVGHNTNLQPTADVGTNKLLPADGEAEYTFSRSQNLPVPVSCNIHPWMFGYIIPRENPYVAVSAADGTFTLEKLPAGELEFVAWQEKAGYLEPGDWKRGRFTVNIGPETTDLGEIKLAPSLFE